MVRFIPAGAGNTAIVSPLSAGRSVYPRWRGEHSVGLIDLGHISGLSPLARGTLALLIVANQYGRFIPAGAGNTFG